MDALYSIFLIFVGLFIRFFLFLLDNFEYFIQFLYLKIYIILFFAETLIFYFKEDLQQHFKNKI